MFSKLTTSLVLMMSVMLASNSFAQTVQTKKKQSSKKSSAKTTVSAADQAALDAAAAKKAEEEAKALEAKRLEEAKAAAEKAKAAEANSGFLGYLKSHFTASYHGEYYFQRRIDFDQDALDNGTPVDENDKKLQDLKIMHNPTVTYRFLNNWKFLATSEFKYTDAAVKGTFINRHYRSLFLLTRENVLVEKEDGIKLDLGIGRRVFDRNHGAATSYGNNRVNATIGKKFGDKFSTSTLIQYLGNDPAKGKIKSTTWKHSLELIPSFTWQITEKLSYFFNDDFVLNSAWQNNTAKTLDFSHEMNIGVVSYQFNDKNSAYFQFKYLRVANAPFQDPNKIDDWFEYYIGHTYAFTPKISLTSEIGSEIFRAHDGRDFFARKLKYPEFALYVDMSL
jgi:hypothetical protein